MAHIPGAERDGQKINKTLRFRYTPHLSANGLKQREIAFNPSGLRRKSHFEGLDHGGYATRHVKNFVADPDMFKTLGAHFEKSHVIGNAESFVNLPQGAALTKLSDIMDPRAETVAPTQETVTQPPGAGMLFQDKHPFARSGKAQGRSEPSGP
jgi:hypothetical protein